MISLNNSKISKMQPQLSHLRDGYVYKKISLSKPYSNNIVSIYTNTKNLPTDQ